MKFLVILLTLTAWRGAAAIGGEDNGFGESYKWAKSLESALEEAQETGKPAMVIIHKTWCSACKKLKPKFAESAQLLDLSRYFVMVNIQDEDEPDQKEYAPDGGYIPRILFVSPAGEVMREFKNTLGSLQHLYFYSQPEQIAAVMKEVLNHFNVMPFNSAGNEEL